MMHSIFRKYAITMLAIAGVFVLKWITEPYIKHGSHVLSSTMILLISFYLGRGPGVLATLLASPLSGYFLYLRTGSDADVPIQIAVYMVEGLAISFFVSSFSKSKSKIESLLLTLEERTKIKDLYISALSHDLRTPLAGIKTRIELMQSDVISDDPKPHYEQIIKVVDRAFRMIDDLLDADRIGSGNEIALEFQTDDFNSLVKEAVEDFGPPLKGRVRLGLDAETTIAEFDRAGMRRVLDNLLGNAIKYGNPLSPINVTVSGGDSMVLLRVQNFGPPIPDEVQSRLFQPFYRLSGLNRKVEGWGLGLSVVHGIVRAHRGSIKVKSSSREGTTFTVAIPTQHHAPLSMY